MRPMRTAYALCVSAGIVTVLAALLPWAQIDVPSRTYGALELRFYGLFATTLFAGVLLIVFGALRTPWAALAAFGNAMLTVYIGLAIHGSLEGALTSLGVSFGAELGHPYGFGYPVLFAGAALAMISAVAVAIEVGPPAGFE